MKKLIITIFIIFIFSTPQVFAVLPHMFRFARLIGIRPYVNSYALYVNPTTHEMLWHIPLAEVMLQVQVGNKEFKVNLQDAMKEAFDEWAPAFSNVTINRSGNLNVPIRVSTNQVANPCTVYPDTPMRLRENAVLTNYRGAYTYNPAYGSIVFYKQCFEKLLNDPAWVAHFREIVGSNTIGLQTIFNMLIKIKAKQAIGKLFGLGATIVPEQMLPLYGFLDNEYEHDITNLRTLTLVYRPPLGVDTTFIEPNELVSIMMQDLEMYLTYVRQRVGRRINMADIRVSIRDIAALRETNNCFLPNQSPTQKEGSIIINCNFAEVKAVIISYLANNTAITTAITSQK